LCAMPTRTIQVGRLAAVFMETAGA
jgi:hypothetical protein